MPPFVPNVPPLLGILDAKAVSGDEKKMPELMWENEGLLTLMGSLVGALANQRS